MSQKIMPKASDQWNIYELQGAVVSWCWRKSEMNWLQVQLLQKNYGKETGNFSERKFWKTSLNSVGFQPL